MFAASRDCFKPLFQKAERLLSTFKSGSEMGNDVDRGTREDNGIEFDKTKDLSETNSGADKTDRITYSLGQGEGEKASEATNGKSKSAKSASDSQASNVLATCKQRRI